MTRRPWSVGVGWGAMNCFTSIFSLCPIGWLTNQTESSRISEENGCLLEFSFVGGGAGVGVGVG